MRLENWSFIFNLLAPPRMQVHDNVMAGTLLSCIVSFAEVGHVKPIECNISSHLLYMYYLRFASAEIKNRSSTNETF